MLFVTFTYAERLWNPCIKDLHTLHASSLNLRNQIEDLHIHIIELIQIDLVTCVRYYDHKTCCVRKLITKDHYFLAIYIIIEFQNRGNKHDHGLLWMKNAPMYEVHTNEKIE
jgi:hypothetical protein